MTTTTIRIGNETARVGDFIVFTASRSRDDWDWGEIMGLEEVDGVASGVTVVQADIYWHGSETRHSMADEQLTGARVYRTLEGAREAFRAASVSDEQLRALKAEAGAAGDDEQVALCALALSGDIEARAECARVIADAAAMAD